MRYLFGFLCGVAFCVMPLLGCSDNGGTGGTGGTMQADGFAYVANGTSGDVSQYSIGTDGTLSPLAPATVRAGDRPQSVTVAPSGQIAYVANFDTIAQYSVGTDGTLSPLTPAMVGAGTRTYSITVDPQEQFAYVANSASNDVSQYSIGADGTLSPLTPATVAAGTSPQSVAVDPSGSSSMSRIGTATPSPNTASARTAHSAP